MTKTVNTRLDELAANIRQLVEPIHFAHHGHIHTRPGLLDQLRDATQPSHGHPDGSRRTIPTSRPPLRLDALDALYAIRAELSGWHARIGLGPPPPSTDWQKTALRALVRAWPHITPGCQEWLHADVESWWRLAAHITGWTPTDLRRLR